MYISYTYALPIGEPLDKEILKQGHLIKWFSDEEEGKEGLKGKPNVLNDIDEAIDYRPHIVLSITDSVPDFISGLKVQIFHGFNAEKRKANRDHFRIRGLFDLYCTQGPSTTSVFKELKKKSPHFEVIETGWSKVDPLFPIEGKHATPIPTVFIASTFTERLSLAVRDDVFREIKRLSEKGVFNFQMVLHPKLPTEIKEKWASIDNPHFEYFDTTFLNPLFRKADVMFSDTTSAIQEFGLQLKPTVTLNHHVPCSYLIDISSVDQIESALKKALTYPEDILEELRKYNHELHPYTDGKSSERVINTCIEFLQTDKSHLKKKPLNLVRRIKMRKHLKTWGFKYYLKPYTVQFPDPKKTREPLTAIIPVKNEIKHIEEVIRSVDFADEILVIDSYSTDGTYEKALETANRVLQRKFDNYSKQKNWGISQAKNEWILLVDADERVTPELRAEILEVLENPSKNEAVGYWIGRQNHFMGKKVRYSGWRNDKVLRLIRKSKCRYEDMSVHERMLADGKVYQLKEKFFHNTYRSLDEYMEKMNHYASLQAIDYDKKTGRLGLYHFMVKPSWRFFKHYIIQGGFRDGLVGLVVCYIQGYTVFMRYTKLWLLRKGRK